MGDPVEAIATVLNPAVALPTLAVKKGVKALTPKLPELPKLPTPKKSPRISDPLIQAARNASRKRFKSGRGSTVATGARGLVDQPVLSSKTLLGQ